MNYTWNVMVSWLLLQFLVPAQSSFQEGILESSSNNIYCDRNTTIQIVDSNVQQYTTSCPEIKHCNLTDQQISDIKSGCNEKKSCTISTIIPNSCVVNDYGHVSVLYSCTDIVNSSCTFESGMCGWTIDGSDNYKWTLQSGKSDESDTGPDRDHTTASANGHYMSTISDRYANENAESGLFTGLIVSSPKQCLTFWYHMYGDDVKTLKLFQLSSKDNVELWSKSYNQGNKWYFQSLELNNIGSYRLQFKATRGDGDESEIAVDDIFITNSGCKKAIDCNFERGQCEWHTGEPTYQWTNWHDSTPTVYTGPDVDHTLATSVGEYIYLEALGISPGRRSNLTSETIYPDGDACFTFWYFMYGRGMGTLNVYLDIHNLSRVVWSKSGNRKKRWWLASFDISTSEPYTLKFEGIRGKYSTSDIALDDITLISGSCEADSKLHCNFEEETCKWKTESDSQYNWKLNAGATTSSETGPQVDHTSGFSDGYYLYLEATNRQSGSKSNLTSDTVFPENDDCFTFWYHMYGGGMGTLNVYLVSKTMKNTLWTKSGNQQDTWQLAHMDISIAEPYSLTLEGIRGSTSKSDIAIDDISLLPGSCNKRAFVLNCGFELGTCNWSTYPETQYIWKIKDRPISSDDNGPYNDHTTGSAEGQYVYLEQAGLDLQPGVASVLTSSTINPGGNICFSFWYHMYGENIGTLRVYTKSDNNTEQHWLQSGNHDYSWLFVNFDISISEPYRIIFEGVRRDDVGNDMALDDILLHQRACSALVDCNFEVAKCYWMNYPELSIFWKISNSPILTDDNGPYNDHTTESADGHYIFLRKTGVKGVKYNLTSLIFNTNEDSCFTFWYHMYGVNIGTLSVYTVSSNTTERRWSQTGNNGNSWQFASFDISISEPFRIIFEGVRGDDVWSDISIDDILLHRRSCSGLISSTHACPKTNESISLPECSKYYLQLNKTSVVFQPKFDDCSADYQDIQTSIINLCNEMDNSDICIFNLSDVSKADRRCFQSNRLLIKYTCEADETTSVSSIVESTKSTSAGLVVGLVIGGLLLVSVVIFIVIFVRRQTFGLGSKEKVRNNLHENDYIGCQDIALAQAADHSGLMQCTDKQTLNDDEYAIINPSAETSFNAVISDGNRTADSYLVLDPNDTGFQRTPFSNTPGGYEFAKRVKEKNNGDDDQYAVSEGVYDHSGNIRHKESEDTIYNHAVDTIYDSGSHKRNDEGREDTYDHFFGQTTEDDYDISTTT